MRHTDVARILQGAQAAAATRDATAVDLVKAEETLERTLAAYREACEAFEQAEAKARALRPNLTANVPALRLGVVP